MIIIYHHHHYYTLKIQKHELEILSDRQCLSLSSNVLGKK